MEREQTSVNRGRLLVGVVILAIGVFSLTGNLVDIRFDGWHELWPLILVTFGLYRFSEAEEPRRLFGARIRDLLAVASPAHRSSEGGAPGGSSANGRCLLDPPGKSFPAHSARNLGFGLAECLAAGLGLPGDLCHLESVE